MKVAKVQTMSVRIVNNYYGSVSKSKNLKKQITNVIESVKEDDGGRGS